MMQTKQLNQHEIPSTPATILVIDDNPVNLSVIAEYLEEQQFRVLTAPDGEMGVRRAQFIKPDIILLDVMMPGIDGFETCRRLKADDRTLDIPIIFMTALASTEDKIKGFTMGAVDYVTKPVQYEEVLVRIKTHLTISRQKEQLANKARQLESAHQIGQQVTTILDLEPLMTTVVEAICTQFNYYFVSVWLINQEKNSLVLRAGSGREGVMLNDSRLPLETRSLIGTAYCNKAPVFVPDVHSDPRFLAVDHLPNTRSELAMPLRVGQEVLGVLDIQVDETVTIDPGEDVILLQMLVNQIAIAIHNAQLYAMEKQLRQMVETRAHELSELNASKDKFFSIVSHDLRSPFGGLLSLANMMLEEVDTISRDELKEMLEMMYDSAQATFDLLENLLTWSRLQRGRMVYQPKLVDLYGLTDKTVAVLRESAQAKGVTLMHQISPQTLIVADSQMIQTVLRNLVSNAVKFTPTGGEVTIYAQPYTNGHNGTDASNLLEVAVADTGIGMKQEDMDKLFRLDVHHTTVGTAKEQGTGLGLIMCQEMMALHDAKICVESEAGKGTKMRFTLPKLVSDV